SSVPGPDALWNRPRGRNALGGWDKRIAPGPRSPQRGSESYRQGYRGKKLLQPPPRVRPIDTVLEVGDAPFKGKKDAKLTLVEFSDYLETTVPELRQVVSS
ncbi:MAG: hypothetical protein ACREU9_11240, partial [Gammaproteobacteria bacterium]